MGVLALWDIESLSREWNKLSFADAKMRLGLKSTAVLEEMVSQWQDMPYIKRVVVELLTGGQAGVDVIVAKQFLERSERVAALAGSSRLAA